ncbi:hypothetical protein TW95_gp0668 [Pandoravirus inopinatum]|uniref:Uncharacterized protein n=1 Tax=Pandoravirus inopinatum TaxID=1605721 RepID=A0A0B5JCM7_9VIRU|nr:hypothetical protein TW95_gp0668 [Pandoravirus inopinatum]AJF97402.1 hypothetical protein [Pandoravirus inopinatum]
MDDRPATVNLVLVCASRPSTTWTVADVDARALCLASPVFAAMLDGDFVESRLDTVRLALPLDPDTPQDTVEVFVKRCQGHAVLDAITTLWLWDTLAFVFIDMAPFIGPLVDALLHPDKDARVDPALVIGAHALHACPVRGQTLATSMVASAATGHFGATEPFTSPSDGVARRVTEYMSCGETIVRTWFRLSAGDCASMVEKAAAWIVDARRGLLAAAATTALADWHRTFARLDAYTRVPFAWGVCRPLTAGPAPCDGMTLCALAACEDDSNALVGSHDDFLEALANDSPTIVQALRACALLGDPAVVIAGGAVINAVQAPHLRKRLDASDIDLWIVGPSDVDRRYALDRVVRTLFDALPGCRSSHRGSVVTIETVPPTPGACKPDARTERIQIISTGARSGAEVISRFDLAHACGWHDVDGVGLSWDAMWAIVTRRTRALPGVEPIASRLSKAVEKGFAPDDVKADADGEPMYMVDGATIEWHPTADAILADFSFMPIQRNGDPKPRPPVASPFVPHARHYDRCDDGYDAFDKHLHWRGFAWAQPTRVETPLLTVLTTEARTARFSSTVKTRLTLALEQNSPLWEVISNADARFFERANRHARGSEYRVEPDDGPEPLPRDPMAALAVSLLRHCHPDPMAATRQRHVEDFRAQCHPTLTRCSDGTGHSFAIDCTLMSRMVDGLTGGTYDANAIVVGSHVAVTMDIAGGMWNDWGGGRLMIRLISARIYPSHMHEVFNALSSLPSP